MVEQRDLPDINSLTGEWMQKFRFDDLPARQHNGAIAFATDLSTGSPVWYDESSETWRAFGEDVLAEVIPENFVYDHLHDDVSDSDDMNVDGSVTAVNYDFTVPAGKVFLFTRLNAQTRDNTKDIPNGFFSIAALTNGLLIQVLDTNGVTVLQDFDTTAAPIMNHADMIALAGVDVDTDSTANVSAGGFRFTLTKTGAAMRLTAGQVIRVVVRDNLSSLQELRFMVQGLQRDAA